jgi:sugar-specific transcriptional regulator TrmB
MNEEPVRRILIDVGLTEKETDVYIFLAKHGALKGAEIAKLTNTDKAETYRILRSLQRKSLLEETLEAPTRFTTVPFDKVLDSFIKTRRDEVSLIENAKNSLLDDWEKISKPSFELSAEKFVVIEGENKIYSRIFQLLNESKNQLSAISTYSGIVQANRFGIFNALVEHQLKSSVQVRFITDFSEKDISLMKRLFRRISRGGYSLKWRIPDLGLKSNPTMLIRDEEEILLFITPKNEAPRRKNEEVCLWTNCKTIVQSFIRVFTDIWNNSTDIEEKLAEIESGKPSPKTYVIKDAESARKTYEQVAEAAKEEIVLMTSSQGLVTFSKNNSMSKGWAKNGLKVRFMAPILGENLKVALEMPNFEVRHVPASYLTKRSLMENIFFSLGILR